MSDALVMVSFSSFFKENLEMINQDNIFFVQIFTFLIVFFFVIISCRKGKIIKEYNCKFIQYFIVLVSLLFLNDINFIFPLIILWGSLKLVVYASKILVNYFKYKYLHLYYFIFAERRKHISMEEVVNDSIEFTNEQLKHLRNYCKEHKPWTSMSKNHSILDLKFSRK